MGQKRFYAHSLEGQSKDVWQTLSDHLHGVALRAAWKARPFGGQRAARVSGAFHDLGKYSPDYLRRLEGGPRVDHSAAGARAVLDLTRETKSVESFMAQIVAYAIFGHHAGLHDRKKFSDRLKDSIPALDPCWRMDIDAAIPQLRPPGFTPGDDAAFSVAFLGRMIFSCLIAADREDTEAFYGRAGQRAADRNWPRLPAVVDRLRARLDAHVGNLRSHKASGDHNPHLHRLRGEILAHVRGRAAEPPGMFTLTVPTGGGKTLASLAFALDHAATHKRRRIIYAIPFTSIIDQTADAFRKILGDDYVLEHHSAIEDVRADRDGSSSVGGKLRGAMEDWAAPIIVTTSVQLFESLFAARPSRCRKLHNIVGSIIVLDEAQTLPTDLLIPCVQALRELERNYGCTIVFCTATQPALDEGRVAHPLIGLPLKNRELAPDPLRLAREMRRVTLRRSGEMDDETLVAELAAVERGLIVVNSRQHALALFRAAKAAGLDGLIHLTTRQCAAHRRRWLADARQRLQARGTCRVIATSLIEAGVDLDFDRVWRAEAGLDQIAQAAGRCNRESLRDPADSMVTIFQPAEYARKGEISKLVEAFRTVAGRHAADDLLSPAALEEFFDEVYWRKCMGQDMSDLLAIKDRTERVRASRKKSTGLDRRNILSFFLFNGAEACFNYDKAAAAFRMIDEEGKAPVIVPFDPQAQGAIHDLEVEAISSGALARRLQPYTVGVPDRAFKELLAAHEIVFVAPHLRGDQFAVLLAPDRYQDDVGLVWEEAGQLGSRSLV